MSGALTGEALAKFSVAPSTPIAAFVKRLRCRRCGSQSVLATRRPNAQKASKSASAQTSNMQIRPLIPLASVLAGMLARLWNRFLRN